MYTHTVHLRSGVPVRLVSKEMPTLSDDLLMNIEKPDGEQYTFLLEAVAYISTKRGV
jgi:hypothetical protein